MKGTLVQETRPSVYEPCISESRICRRRTDSVGSKEPAASFRLAVAFTIAQLSSLDCSSMPTGDIFNRHSFPRTMKFLAPISPLYMLQETFMNVCYPYDPSKLRVDKNVRFGTIILILSPRLSSSRTLKNTSFKTQKVSKYEHGLQ